jgi:hemoglobin
MTPVRRFDGGVRRPLPNSVSGMGERDGEQADQQVTVYEAVGGELFFVTLVDRFYDLVETDDLVRPLYPDDLTESRRTTAGFLSQLFGGPPRYSAERGHPRLRMRHAPFAIGVAERDRWVAHMTQAVRENHLAAEIEEAMINYFETAATHMINQPG